MKQNNITAVMAVKGMTCSNCELRIENTLKRLHGLTSAKADYANESIRLTYDPSDVKECEIIAAIEQMGYNVKPKGEPGSGSDNPKASLKPMRIIIPLAVVAALSAILLAIRMADGLNISALNPNMGYGILFAAGMATSLHCIAMCGGINLSICVSYSAKKNDGLSKLLPGALYNAGRVISYTIVGGAAGALGSVINISRGTRGVGAVIAGIFMLLMGLNMLGLFPALRKILPRMPKMFGNKLYDGIGQNSPLVIGLLSGLMPCGPLQSMQLYALGTGSFLSGALSMFIFSLGTVPAMFGFGAVSSILSRRFTDRMMKVSAIFVMLLGAITFAMGLMARR